jgi:curved DNA-binding protein CbpA
MAERDAYDVLGLLPTAHDTVIQAAYRALAALYHPDARAAEASTHRMAELNLAYARLRTPERRALYDAERTITARDATIVAPATGPGISPMRGGGSVLTFGRYEGWSIDRLAKHDPEYLRWLRRHSSGIRYRAEIEQALAQVSPEPTYSERTRGR